MNKIISWFQSLPVPIQILSILVTWCVIMIWILLAIANIDWCPPQSHECGRIWINIASIISIIMIWGAGMLGTAMYYDHKGRE